MSCERSKTHHFCLLLSNLPLISVCAYLTSVRLRNFVYAPRLLLGNENALGFHVVYLHHFMISFILWLKNWISTICGSVNICIVLWNNFLSVIELFFEEKSGCKVPSYSASGKDSFHLLIVKIAISLNIYICMA